MNVLELGLVEGGGRAFWFGGVWLGAGGSVEVKRMLWLEGEEVTLV